MKKSVLLLLFILILFLFLGGGQSRAQVSQYQSLEKQRIQLEQELKNIEKQISNNKDSLTKLKSEKNTLAHKIKQLEIERSGLILKIKAMSISLDRSTIELSQIQFQISQNQEKLNSLQNHLATIINELWKNEQSSWFDLILRTNNFSSFYSNLHYLEGISKNLDTLVQATQIQENKLKDNKELFANQRQKQENFISIINLQNSQIAQNIQNQNSLLRRTRGKESNYQTLLKKNQKQATIIRNRIYSLASVGASKQITFGQAVEIAKLTSQQTGVRAALLLAILSQESNLGKNVGTCNRRGDPPSKSWKVIMSPRRDQQPFIQITKSLGLNIDITPVSCPMHRNGKQIGWGGAMGPAQFIPSTWLGYKSKISAITGRTANPWNIHDAFLAAGLKLKADGGGTRQGEWAAAMRYFSGGTNPAYSFYGDNVIATANRYQKDIDELNSK